MKDAIVIRMEQETEEPCTSISHYGACTVGQLIKRLSMYDPDMPVLLEDGDASQFKFGHVDLSSDGIREVEAVQPALFSQCFSMTQYKKAKEEVELSLEWSGLHDLAQLMQDIGGYDEDAFGESFICEREIDLSRRATECDYASFVFKIGWDAKDEGWEILGAKLYASDYGHVCSFSPETCEVTEWL